MSEVTRQDLLGIMVIYQFDIQSLTHGKVLLNLRLHLKRTHLLPELHFQKQINHSHPTSTNKASAKIFRILNRKLQPGPAASNSYVNTSL